MMSPTAGPVLLVGAGPQEGTTIPLLKEQMVIGRYPTMDIVVNEPMISRQHAVIQEHTGGFWITDLGSRNGTSVNGTRSRSGNILVENNPPGNLAQNKTRGAGVIDCYGPGDTIH